MSVDCREDVARLQLREGYAWDWNEGRPRPVLGMGETALPVRHPHVLPPWRRRPRNFLRCPTTANFKAATGTCVATGHNLLACQSL